MSWPEPMPIAVVEWTDIQSHNGWMDESETKKRFAEGCGLKCRSVGYLYRNDDQRVALIQNTAENGMFGDVLEIPRATVTSVQTIAVPE